MSNLGMCMYVYVILIRQASTEAPVLLGCDMHYRRSASHLKDLRQCVPVHLLVTALLTRNDERFSNTQAEARQAEWCYDTSLCLAGI